MGVDQCHRTDNVVTCQVLVVKPLLLMLGATQNSCYMSDVMKQMSYDPCQATGAQCKRGYCKTRFQQTFLDKDSVSVDPDESPADHGQVRDGSAIQKGIFKKCGQRIIVNNNHVA